MNAPVDAERCQCGHMFESTSQSPQESALRDEELYEGYLSARAEQSLQVAYVTEQALLEEPGNPELISAAELAREVARSIEADLDAQRTKITALRRALPVIKPVMPVVKPAVVPAHSSKVAAPLALPEVTAVIGMPPAQLTLASSATTHVAPALNPALQRASTAQKAAGVLAALKSAKAKEAVVRARQAAVAEREIPTQAQSPMLRGSAAPSSTPSPAFRQDQSAKAEKVMEAHKAIDAKECPNCTANVPLNTSRCHCGFTFISGNTDLPSLTLCTGDFTALRNSLKLNLR